MREVVIVDGARSAFGKMGGGLRSMAACELGGFVLRGLVEKTGILERGAVDSVIAGNALGDPKSQDIARYACLAAGLPYETAATFVEMQCGSAIAALNHAAWKIQAGMSEVAIVGGMECYSTLPAKFPTTTPPFKGIAPRALKQGLAPDPEKNIDMIQVSDKMAHRWDISREACDAYSVRSQQRLQEAYRSGLIGPEIVPYVIPATRKAPQQIVNQDEFPRANTTMESLGKLRAVYEGGVTTAGNASGRNDGAAFLLVMTAEKAKEYGYRPYAKWVSCAHAGVRADLMGIAPTFSNLEAMARMKLRLRDIDVFECNEAFAAQNLSVIKELENQTGEKIDQSKWNPNGGAIAIGHPNGASGARIAWFAMKQLEKTGGKYGVVSSCCGGGLGATAIIENLRR